jgi:(E)-4-hydroxy-3-methylbut-2-enyl-diphosphate synthase
MRELLYCANPFLYQRRLTREVKVDNVGIGGTNPIRVQSMITSDTMDTELSIQQTMELAKVGCEIVRITAPTVKDARNLENIVKGLRARGCDVPIVADIHFKPEAAMEAAKWVDKVRINPGNYADSKKFVIREYTDEQYAAELGRIRERFTPLVALCKKRGIAMRIGTNHGSLSDRILNRYGDTPLGMVESALEFARIARDLDYHAFVFSMKASNPKIMIAAYRLLVARLNELDAEDARNGRGGSPEPPGRLRSIAPTWNYPIHLGVTEAGEGEDARIKSAIGIGSLLADGIGDTIRVSLTEDSPQEIPVARALINQIDTTSNSQLSSLNSQLSFDPFSYQRRATEAITASGIGDSGQEIKLGGEELIRVVVRRANFEKIAHKIDKMGDYKPEIVYENAQIKELDPLDETAIAELNQSSTTQLVTLKDGVDLPVIAAFRLLAARLHPRHPILLKDVLNCRASVSDANVNDGVSQKRPTTFLDTLLIASTNIGSLLCDGIGDAILVQGEESPGQALRLSYNILQAAGSRIFKTDYVACPSCGRTLFNLQATTAKIKAATLHLKGVKIAIMGCIVNGPGEMADADFGYVGGAPGKVNLYVGKTAVKFNIPEAEAVDRLQDLIREHGKWMEPAKETPVLA